jgi:hypothetical protein
MEASLSASPAMNDDGARTLAQLLGAAPPPVRPPAKRQPAARPTPTPVASDVPLADRGHEHRTAEQLPPATAVATPLAEQLLFSPEQAGVLLQVPGSWLRKQAAAGTISSILLGRRLLFARADLDALIETNRRPARSHARRVRSGH